MCVLETVLAATVFFYTALGWLLSARAGYADEDDDAGFARKAFVYVVFAAMLLISGAL